MSGQSGHNLNIAKSKLGAPRFPFERADVGNSYAGAGPIKTYKLNPEEIAARYGPPAPRRDRDLTRGEVKFAVGKAESVEHAARIVGVSVARIKKEMTRHCIAVPEHWKEAEEEVGLEEFKAALDKEKYLELKQQGMSDKKILEAVGLSYNSHVNYLTNAKKEWGVAGMMIVQKEQQPETSQPSTGDEPEKIIDQVPKAGNDGNNEQIAWVVPFKPAKKFPVLRFYQNGISINAAAARAMEGVRNVRVGVTSKKIIILAPSETKEGCYELGKLHKRSGSLKIGGTALVEQIKKHGVPFGKYRLEHNEAKGRFEARTDEVVCRD